MNISAKQFDDNSDFVFDTRKATSTTPKRQSATRRDSTRNKRSAPKQFNGIHRRRKKKIRW